MTPPRDRRRLVLAALCLAIAAGYAVPAALLARDPGDPPLPGRLLAGCLAGLAAWNLRDARREYRRWRAGGTGP